MSEPNNLPTGTRIAVIGAGTIGCGWASLFLCRGHDVALSDPAPDFRGRFERFHERARDGLGRIGLATRPEGKISFASDPAIACDGAALVQENAPERLDVKRALYARIEQALAPEAIVASSTSGLKMSELQAGCRHPERFAVGHPFNPPHLIPLVEVVGGKETSEATIERLMAFYAGLGKRPIRLNAEVAGHLANRLQVALWREAVHAVASGLASVADVDAAIAYGPGLRWAMMGPNLTFHLAGGEGGFRHFLEHLAPAVEAWWQDLGTPTLTPELKQRLAAGVEAEAGNRSIEELARLRDERLLQLLSLPASGLP
ncbi:MAG: 3-hydroxyacyl-CoA dehydrogenase NAD-binding domain-containing protein [Alphaproteobacteria bacterium]